MHSPVVLIENARSLNMKRRCVFFIALTSISVFIGLPFASLFGLILGVFTRKPIELLFPPFYIGLLGEVIFIPLIISCIITSGIIGVIQSFVIRTFSHQNTQRAVWWMFFSALGWTGGLFVVLVGLDPAYQTLSAFFNASMAGILSGTLMGALGGVVVGVLQGVLLRKNLNNVFIWVIANLMSWALFWLLLWGVIGNFFSGWGIS